MSPCRMRIQWPHLPGHIPTSVNCAFTLSNQPKSDIATSRKLISGHKLKTKHQPISIKSPEWGSLSTDSITWLVRACVWSQIDLGWPLMLPFTNDVTLSKSLLFPSSVKGDNNTCPKRLGGGGGGVPPVQQPCRPGKSSAHRSSPKKI